MSTQASYPPRRRRWRKLGLLLPLVVVLLPMGIYRYNAWRLNRQLDKLVAELDQNEPGWRLDELERDRKVIPDEENGARVVTAAVKGIPADWLTNPVWEQRWTQPPALRFPAATMEQMRGQLKLAEAALGEARKLSRYPSGRFAIDYTPDFVGTLVPHLQHVRDAATLLESEIHVLADEGRADLAWSCCRAILQAGETLADEPLLISQLVRIAVQSTAVRAMERVLAQAEAAPQTLSEARRLFQLLSRQNVFLVGMRGERAGWHLTLPNLLNGSVQLADLGGKKKNGGASLWDRASQAFVGNMIREAHVYMLRYLTRVVAAARLDTVEQAKAVVKLELDFKHDRVTGDVPKLAGLFIPAFWKIAEADRRHRAQLTCTYAALAAEEYRLKHQRWPDSAEQLVQAGLLKQVPLDLYDGQPLRWRRTSDGLVIHSIGPSGKYDGDALDDNRAPKSEVRVEFRLWNPDRRRQAPAAENEPLPKG